MKTKNILTKIWARLTPRRRWQITALTLMMVLSSVAEIVSLASVQILLTTLADTEALQKKSFVSNLWELLSVVEPDQVKIFAVILFCLITITAATIRIINLWLNGRFAAAIGSDLSCETYRRTLYQPYEKQIQHNSSEAISTSTMDTYQTVVAINLMLQSITALLVSIGITATLWMVNPQVTLFAASAFSLAYFFLSQFTSKELALKSKGIAHASQKQLQILREGFGSVREIIINNTQENCVKLYKDIDLPLRNWQADANFIGTFPRFFLEALGFLLLAICALFVSADLKNSLSLFATLGTLGVGSQRLLLSLQQVYVGLTGVRARASSIELVVKALDINYVGSSYECINPLRFDHDIAIESVCFRYGEESPWILRDLSINFKKGERIGIIGSTGSGKSTFLDLFSGLLSPLSGEILIDGRSLSNIDVLLSWQANIAYVSQATFLSDSSIMQNIAFGIPQELIDFDKVVFAANLACIDDFIESTEDGYNTLVGESGVRLSGGQKQRIGIARALYKKSQVLILDEATSALDKDTESSVINSIFKSAKTMTVIMVAHRLSALKSCDRVIELKNGKVQQVFLEKLE